MEPVNIDNPPLWRLVLGISSEQVHAIATSTVADSSMIYRRLPLQPGCDLSAALEEAIYTSPWVLSDFGRIDIAVSTPDFTVVPAGLNADVIETCTRLSCIADQDMADLTSFADHTEQTSVLWAFDTPACHFLARTFRNAPMQHTSTPMLRYFTRLAAQGNGAKIYVYLHGQNSRQIELTAYRKGARTALVTQKTVSSDTDALYYILGVAKLIDFDVENDHVLVFGDAADRTRLTTLAGRYLRHVMPLIFPSAALRAGRDAFKAPFPLIILPLCE